MPTTTVNATLQGIASQTVTASSINWATQVRDGAGNSSTTITVQTSTAPAFGSRYMPGRGGVVNGTIYRTLLFFDDLNTATGNGNITAATLKIFNQGNGDSNTESIIIEATAWGSNGSTTTLSNSDYANVDNSTAYSSKLSSWGGNGYNDYTLNSSAISDINTNGYLNCSLIEYNYDYDNNSPPLFTLLGGEVTFLKPDKLIKLEITYTPAFNSITTYSSVIGVAAANISSINSI